jgi:hypothetical protein
MLSNMAEETLDPLTYIDAGEVPPANRLDAQTVESNIQGSLGRAETLLGTSYREQQLAKQEAHEMERSARREPLITQLRRQKLQAEREVSRLHELICLLDKNPDTERILTLLH